MQELSGICGGTVRAELRSAWTGEAPLPTLSSCGPLLRTENRELTFMADDQNPELPLTPPPGGDGQSPGALNMPPVNIEDEMKRSYLDSSISVIIGPALTDAPDGFKPVHRRILSTMRQIGLAPALLS